MPSLDTVRRLGTNLLVLTIAVFGCEAGEAGPSYAVRLVEPRTLPVPARSYNSAAWLRTDRIALSSAGGEGRFMRIDLIDPQGVGKGPADMGPRPECDYRDFMTLARLPTGELGLADVCGEFRAPEPESADFVAVDVETGVPRNLGRAVERPFYITWKEDLTAVYAAGNDLCVTLYVHAAGQETPLDLEVVSEGQRFKAGQDIRASPDGCPSGGRAGYPAYSPDGRTLAFMASGNGTNDGQDVIDAPWTIFATVDQRSPQVVVGGVRHPGDLIWLLDGSTVVFAGEVSGRQGVWRVKSDGSELTLLSKIDALHMALAPDGTVIVALLAPRAPEQRQTANDVVILELP